MSGQEQVQRYKSTQPLAAEIFVAVMIHHITEVKKEHVWFGKLVDECKEYMSKNTVSEALDTLVDWMVIAGEYGATENGRAGYLWYIDTKDGGDLRIKELHDKYWATICPGVA